MVKNLFAYALGRDVNFADEKEINNIVKEVKDNDYRFRTIIEQIVLSPSFYKKEESWFSKLVGGWVKNLGILTEGPFSGDLE